MSRLRIGDMLNWMQITVLSQYTAAVGDKWFFFRYKCITAPDVYSSRCLCKQREQHLRG